MNQSDSKELWLYIDQKIRPDPIKMSLYTTQAYMQYPIRKSFISSRYKFCARMLKGQKKVLEIGCGDGYGSEIVAQLVDELICTDINEDLLVDNRKRMSFCKNTSYEYLDFLKILFPHLMDAIYLIDTIEHIFHDEEAAFMSYLIDSLNDKGVCLIGTQNITADQYANNWYRE